MLDVQLRSRSPDAVEFACTSAPPLFVVLLVRLSHAVLVVSLVSPAVRSAVGFPFAAAALVYIWLSALLLPRRESLLVIRSLGLQVTAHSPFRTSTRFIPLERIRDIWIHEAFYRGWCVKHYMCIVVDDQEDLVVVFEVGRRSFFPMLTSKEPPTAPGHLETSLEGNKKDSLAWKASVSIAFVYILASCLPQKYKNPSIHRASLSIHKSLPR
ncbi:Phosphatidylinositol N-acetylglucosaminyltransferase subunit gpi15 [Neolecta irregularis DAH-3]|uniref:Phosphatidylinositol N-acetylglucosaminyltransferase subunit gpi15 n=1 Tax=Neolecta irregularis (strain DAH-3) TaxID=1198029 RepID=A0A1U7LK96_NEOID|nr:Phosphatidylinositol N-acetylglucosaminyltransferase subunit gpi15 [Neolecta irregularis DAH-3]|eukprot:OLL22972.1 Phosphatidylinositol N-acetylglucosaminyltransferase subunit gpi15 [Neolecta irregularis DAH-3]